MEEGTLALKEGTLTLEEGRVPSSSLKALSISISSIYTKVIFRQTAPTIKMIHLQSGNNSRANFMTLYIRVKQNQKQDRVEMVGEDWQIRLKAPAVDGKANEHLIGYLSEVIGISKSRIILKKGATSKIKCLEINEEDGIVFEKLKMAMAKNEK